MNRWIKFFFLFAGAVFAFFLGAEWKSDGKFAKKLTRVFEKKKEEAFFAVVEHKPFVVIVPSYNNSLWVEKNLRSIFEQKYDNYRVIYINDASTDSTLLQVEELTHQFGQAHRFVLIDNETNRGAMENIYRAVHLSDHDEIVVVLDGDDWFSHDRVLERLNEIYANPEVWVTWGSYVEYPSYSTQHVANFARPLPLSVIESGKVRDYSKKHWCLSQLRTFYAGLFKQLKLKDLMFEGKFVDATNDVAFFVPVMEMAGPHARYVDEVLYIWNRATPLNDDKVRGKRQLQIADSIYQKPPYSRLDALPEESEERAQTADFIIFSYDRPLQLYALLESIEKYCLEIDQTTVIFRCSGSEYDEGYALVSADFPNVKMVRQSVHSQKDFQPNVMQALKSGRSDYFIFAVDDSVITDAIDASEGIEALQKTDAFGFFYRLGKEIDYDYTLNLSIELPPLMRVDDDVYAWIFKQRQGYWGNPSCTDVVLYKKEMVLRQLEKIRFSNPNMLESEWLKKAGSSGIGLCHGKSKMVNLPLNLVNLSDNRSLQSMSPKVLLEKFHQNLKMDIAPLDGYPHRSVHVDYSPSFTPRTQR